MINQNNEKVVKKQKFPYYTLHTVYDPLTGRTHKLMWKQDRSSCTPVKFV